MWQQWLSEDWPRYASVSRVTERRFLADSGAQVGLEARVQEAHAIPARVKRTPARAGSPPATPSLTRPRAARPQGMTAESRDGSKRACPGVGPAPREAAEQRWSASTCSLASRNSKRIWKAPRAGRTTVMTTDHRDETDSTQRARPYVQLMSAIMLAEAASAKRGESRPHSSNSRWTTCSKWREVQLSNDRGRAKAVVPGRGRAWLSSASVPSNAVKRAGAVRGSSAGWRTWR